ncbi:hypothetical protein C8R44DRAFT_708628 [Mycena epipterygia]|nr:hypothetical protein C8R44DRAFT_708628 [Mycena epipterygia]
MPLGRFPPAFQRVRRPNIEYGCRPDIINIYHYISAGIITRAVWYSPSLDSILVRQNLRPVYVHPSRHWNRGHGMQRIPKVRVVLDTTLRASFDIRDSGPATRSVQFVDPSKCDQSMRILWSKVNVYVECYWARFWDHSSTYVNRGPPQGPSSSSIPQNAISPCGYYGPR